MGYTHILSKQPAEHGIQLGEIKFGYVRVTEGGQNFYGNNFFFFNYLKITAMGKFKVTQISDVTHVSCLSNVTKWEQSKHSFIQ